jgi:senataxin
MDKLREKPWHKDAVLGPYRFFDVQGQQTFTGSSLTNKMEIDAAMQLFNKLTEMCGSYDFKGKIGIITPYKAQFNAMKRRFVDDFGNSILNTIEFNTTDAFQGRECEIIIFSCVRASEGSIGFLSDYRRMNVGLTRAKCSLWVLGNTKSLVSGKYWRAMIEDAQKRNRISPVADIGRSRPAVTQGSSRPAQNHPSRLNYEDGDVSMGGSSGMSSRNGSRQSSMSSTMANTRPSSNGPSRDQLKQEVSKAGAAEPPDVKMRDISPNNNQYLKSEHAVKKDMKEEKLPINTKPPEHRVAAPPPPPTACGAGSGMLNPPPRVPAQMPMKRKKAPANGALLNSKRPKKQ